MLTENEKQELAERCGLMYREFFKELVRVMGDIEVRDDHLALIFVLETVQILAASVRREMQKTKDVKELRRKQSNPPRINFN